MSMTLNFDAIRREVRALDYARGSSAEAALWRDDDADARSNLATEGMALEPDDCALFDMLREEAVPPPHATAIVLQLLGHPADAQALAITPIEATSTDAVAPARTSVPLPRHLRPSHTHQIQSVRG